MLADYLPKKILWLDLETTGLKEDIHGVVEIAGIMEIDGKIENEFKYNMRPFPTDVIDQNALDIHHKTKEMVLAYEDPIIVRDKIVAEVDPYVDKYNKADKLQPAGYNVDFDIGFLIKFFEKVNFTYFGSYVNYRKQLCVYSIVKMLAFLGSFKSAENLKLETMAKYFNIDHIPHDAISDIKATRELGYYFLRRLDSIK